MADLSVTDGLDLATFHKTSQAGYLNAQGMMICVWWEVHRATYSNVGFERFDVRRQKSSSGHGSSNDDSYHFTQSVQSASLINTSRDSAGDGRHGACAAAAVEGLL